MNAIGSSHARIPDAPDRPHAAASLAEIYGHGAYACFTRAMRLAGDGPVALVRFAQPAGTFPDPPTDDYTLALNEAGAGEMRFDIGTGQHRVAFRPGEMVLKPPGVATCFAMDAPHRKSFVSLPASLVAGLAAEAGLASPPDLGALHAGTIRSAPLQRLVEAMWAGPSASAGEGRLFMDGMVRSLVATLLHLARPAARPDARTPALAPARLARVVEFVAAHLGEPIGLATLAAEAGLSPGHFSRAFKAATGQSPHAYVVASRLERARTLLAGTAMPLAEVAQACGFADQAHFTTCFRAATGTTPGAFRRALA